MRIALTGGSGFLGGYLIREFLGRGWQIRSWSRRPEAQSQPSSDSSAVTWISGELNNAESARRLLMGTDALVHTALDWPTTPRGPANMEPTSEDWLQLCNTNLIGTLQLFQEAIRAGVSRIVFLSSGAVHGLLSPNSPMDETLPPTPLSHYAACKSAIEQWVFSLGRGSLFPICSLRPARIYGIAESMTQSNWFGLIEQVLQGKSVESGRLVLHVHARDVATATALLLLSPADQIRGECFHCFDLYVNPKQVAEIARNLLRNRPPLDNVTACQGVTFSTEKLQRLGMRFGELELLQLHVAELVRWHQLNH